MDRETITITTPKEKHKVVMKSYLIGREKRELASIFLKGDLSFDMRSQDIKGLKGELVEEAQNIAWKTVIVSIDGHKEGETIDGKPFSIIETILDMRSEDYSYLIKAVDKVTKDETYEEKKTI